MQSWKVFCLDQEIQVQENFYLIEVTCRVLLAKLQAHSRVLEEHILTKIVIIWSEKFTLYMMKHHVLKRIPHILRKSSSLFVTPWQRAERWVSCHHWGGTPLGQTCRHIYFSGSRFGLIFKTHLTRGLGDVLGARKTNTATIVKKDMFDIQVWKEKMYVSNLIATYDELYLFVINIWRKS